MDPLDAPEIIERLGLEPLGFEGGFYREQHRSALEWPPGALPPVYSGPRRAATAIYYLLTRTSLSLMHRLKTEEVYHFYLGDPVEQLMLHPDGRTEQICIGPDLRAGHRVQHVVPAGVWQGSRLVPGGRYALMGTTMAPGFELDDFELGDRERLVEEYPKQACLLDALTPPRLRAPGLEIAAATLDLLHADLRGPETLAAGLRCTVPSDWSTSAEEGEALRAELAALEADPERRGWGRWYVLDADARRLLGVARFDGPPDPARVARLELRLPESARQGAFEALEAHARRAGASRVDQAGSPSTET